jgi:hypothetical protein
MINFKNKSIIEKAIDELNTKNDLSALSLFDQAISEGVSLPGLNYGKAVALARLGRVGEAVALLKQMLIRLPDHEKASKLLDELASLSIPDFRTTKNFAETSINNIRPSSWLPDTIYPDDVFIVSYPKSGNTWLRFLLANLLNEQDEINFHTVHKYIPEVGKQKDIVKTLKRPRIMKSHAPYIHEYPKVIYLIRDGRDVYVSYYFHRLKQLSPGCSFGEFLKRQDHYPCTWGEHVSSWLYGPPQSNLLLIKYEDLICDSREQLNRIANYLGIMRTEDQLKSASEKSSFDNMRRLELEQGRFYEDQGPKVFMRKGKSGDWNDFFGKDEKSIFRSREGDILIKLGYETNEKW